MFNELLDYIRMLYNTNEFIPLHVPIFSGNEKKYLMDTIDSTFVSSVGEYVEAFEHAVADYTDSKYAIATVNGTSALHAALIVAGVTQGDEVITQSFTFVATCNAIRYCNAEPVFIDINKNNLGLDATMLGEFLENHCEMRQDGLCWNKFTQRPIRACVVMHSFGFPADIRSLLNLCETYNIKLIEDAAEALGSTTHDQHTGTFGELGVLSFNGNKIITTGGGGVVLTNNEHIAKRLKHLTTTAKIGHVWNIEHDEVAFNYRMPNINAAIGLAQVEMLVKYLELKRKLAMHYMEWCRENSLLFISEEQHSTANYWLNCIVAENSEQRDILLSQSNKNGIMTRPAWKPMHLLPMYAGCQKTTLTNTEWYFDRLVNIPSSVPASWLH